MSGFISVDLMNFGPWQAFERAIARHLVHKGWPNVELVGKVNDKGADVIVGNDKTEILFQVKFSGTSGSLSVDIVGDVKRAMDFYEINQGWCISNKHLGPTQEKKLNTFRDAGYNMHNRTKGDLLEEYSDLSTWCPIWESENQPQPRPYQDDALINIIESYNNGSNKGLISLATGMGKTFVAGLFVKWLYENNRHLNILVLAHTTPLILQFDQALWKFLPKDIMTHILHGKEKPTYFNGGMLYATFQSMEKYIDSMNDYNFDIIIVDEAHHTPAPTYKAIIDRLSPQYLLGLTATPFRMDDKDLEPIFGKPLVKYDVVKGMKNGYLCSVDYRLKSDTCTNKIEEIIADKSLKGYTIKQLNKKIFLPRRDDKMCQEVLGYWNHHNRSRGIIFCNSTKHAKNIEKILALSYSFSAKSLYSGLSSEEKVLRLRKFKRGEISILTVYDMLNEGIDVPDVDFIVFMRITHSRIYFLQQLGRGLRYKEKKKLLVLDYVADLRDISSIYKMHTDFNRDNDPEFIDAKFNFTFSDQTTSEFVNLVTKDLSEEED